MLDYFLVLLEPGVEQSLAGGGALARVNLKEREDEVLALWGHILEKVFEPFQLAFSVLSKNFGGFTARKKVPSRE